MLISLNAGQTGGGIISNAIATAEKEPMQGQENGGSLLHATADKAVPTSTHFTFTCEPQTPGAIQWPGRFLDALFPTAAELTPSGGRSIVQTATHSQNVPAAPPPNPSAQQGNSSKQVSKHPTGSTRKTRSHLERELAIAARHRRQIATENYHHSILSSTEIWICEFCEYERIFGEPPRTLVRDYEIKDRRHRQEEADRKRLLEKAKAKSRKGKKNNNKASAKSGHTDDHVSDQPQATRPTDISPAMTNEPSRSTHSGDDYEDDYEDGDGDSDAPPRHNSNSVATHADPLPPPRAKT